MPCAVPHVKNQIHKYRDWPEFQDAEPLMQFRLTYEGSLRSSGNNTPNAAHKHEIRRAFHPQLRNLWNNNANLNSMAFSPISWMKNPMPGPVPSKWANDSRNYIEYLGDNFAIKDYKVVPLVTEELCLLCGLDILFLRWNPPGRLLSAGDIDNRIKTLFDALKRPSQLSDFGPTYPTPTEDENPFFVLLEDDSLVAKLSVETDTMLEPLVGGIPDENDARLIITVTLHPTVATIHNMSLI